MFQLHYPFDKADVMRSCLSAYLEGSMGIPGKLLRERIFEFLPSQLMTVTHLSYFLWANKA